MVLHAFRSISNLDRGQHSNTTTQIVTIAKTFVNLLDEGHIFIL